MRIKLQADYSVVFEPYVGYAWEVEELDVVLADGVADTEYSAKAACRKVFDDFGMEFPEDGGRGKSKPWPTWPRRR